MNDPVRRRLGDRRTHRRFEIVGQLWGALEAVEPVVLHNLAESGALLEARFSLPKDSVHRIRIASPERTSEVQARVRHVSRPTGGDPGPAFLIGLEFMPLPPLAHEHIAQLIAANSDPLPAELLGSTE